MTETKFRNPRKCADSGSLLLHGFLESLGRAELRYAHGRHFDRLASARVAGGASLAHLGREDTEASDRNLLTLLERVDHAVDHALYGTLGVRFGDVDGLVNFVDDVCLIHRVWIVVC